MSKASEWVKIKPKSLDFIPGISVWANMHESGDVVIGYGDVFMRIPAEGALILGKWLIDTLGEASA